MKGRSSLNIYGVRVFGTDAVPISAKERRLIRQIRPHLDALTLARYRLSADMRREILRLAGEA